MKSKFLPLSIILATLSSSNAVFAESYGIFASDYVADEMILDSSRDIMHPQNSAPLIEDYINFINPDRDAEFTKDLSTKELAQRIAGVSYCFGIDPFVYTGLIHKESIDYNQYAKSPTGAVGLTQFKTIAMKEVNDQLGLRGNKYAQTSAMTYFNAMMMGSCLGKEGGFKVTGEKYQPLWSLAPANTLVKGSSAQATQMVKMLSSNPEYALLYGAILMKVNFSLVKSGYKSGCFEYKSKVPPTMKDKIKEVMMMYNGDGCTTQKKYQSDIIDKYYPRITDLASK